MEARVRRVDLRESCLLKLRHLKTKRFSDLGGIGGWRKQRKLFGAEARAGSSSERMVQEGVRVCWQQHDARTASEHLTPSLILKSPNLDEHFYCTRGWIVLLQLRCRSGLKSKLNGRFTTSVSRRYSVGATSVFQKRAYLTRQCFQQNGKGPEENLRASQHQ